MKSCNTILIPVNVLPHFYKYFIDPINLFCLEGAWLRYVGYDTWFAFLQAGVSFSVNYNQMNYDRLFRLWVFRIPGSGTLAAKKLAELIF